MLFGIFQEIFANGAEAVYQPDETAYVLNAVGNIRRHGEEISLMEMKFFISKEEIQFTFSYITYLFMRMTVRLVGF